MNNETLNSYFDLDTFELHKRENGTDHSVHQRNPVGTWVRHSENYNTRGGEIWTIIYDEVL